MQQHDLKEVPMPVAVFLLNGYRRRPHQALTRCLRELGEGLAHDQVAANWNERRRRVSSRTAAGGGTAAQLVSTTLSAGPGPLPLRSHR